MNPNSVVPWTAISAIKPHRFRVGPTVHMALSFGRVPHKPTASGENFFVFEQFVFDRSRLPRN